ncbi:unnamed protein product (macronuclear) [Paramecium tetraurelia]|uniref:Uncharacterized protein n=1 Tax=Paramecium tetraurelia TaxID=5888 RepID=A0E2H3_PARTE|nr:uncharacterized protein GSPATT00022662001 [Paramecium tetraurelia]CAK89490.1 unnamed protein product [Paramecium tetraurelia]|eukprot:XP_001456887.1 hypothetical protein (macronuclear) [Paramecium tetraurelia strain d4-2]
MLSLLPILLGQVLCQLCEQPIRYESYQYSINIIDPKSAQIWNYDDLTRVNTNCPPLTSDLKDIESSAIQLLDLQIILDIPENLTITRNRTAGPTVQYQTDGIKMRSQGVNNYVSYQSQFFQFTYAEHSLDFQTQTPDGELQIFMIQDQLYSLCDIEPIYSVLSFPIYKLSEQQQLKFRGQFNINTDTISDFNFKQNILGTVKSDISSYITYKAPINIPPCSTAYWYVSTNPLFFQQDQLDQLLQQNQYNKMKRAELQNTVIQYNKGKILFYGDTEFGEYDDTVEWAATWIASIIPCLIFALIACVYGQYEISNIGRYRRQEVKHVEPEIEMLNQEEKQIQ